MFWKVLNAVARFGPLVLRLAGVKSGTVAGKIVEGAEIVDAATNANAIEADRAKLDGRR